MLRILDFFLALFGLVLLSPILFVVYFIGLFDTGSPLFCQTRVGRGQKPFVLVKFRSMKRGTANLASHLVDAATVTPWGKILRRSKLDELPQLWNVLLGDMSLVGPRPCLFNQTQLLREREQRKIFHSRPGITGLAQINGIDMSCPKLLARVDALMIGKMNLCLYLQLIFLTLKGRGKGDAVDNRKE